MGEGHHITPVAEGQRLAGRTVEFLDLADVHHVIPAGMGHDLGAFQMGGAIVDDGHAAQPGVDRDTLELVVGRSGKLVGDLDLVVDKDIDHEALAVARRRVAAGGERLAPMDLRRIERDGVEGIGRGGHRPHPYAGQVAPDRRHRRTAAARTSGAMVLRQNANAHLPRLAGTRQGETDPVLSAALALDGGVNLMILNTTRLRYCDKTKHD